MKYWDKSTKIGRYIWIWIANKLAKFHTKDLAKVKIFQKVGGGATFLKHQVVSKVNYMNYSQDSTGLATVGGAGRGKEYQPVVSPVWRAENIEYSDCIPDSHFRNVYVYMIIQ